MIWVPLFLLAFPEKLWVRLLCWLDKISPPVEGEEEEPKE
jgi:hypothetical protein